MNPVHIFMRDPFDMNQVVVLDVTELTYTQMEERYPEIACGVGYYGDWVMTDISESSGHKLSAGQLLKAWAARVGEFRAGLVILHRRRDWIIRGSHIGFFIGGFFFMSLLPGLWLWGLSAVVRLPILSVCMLLGFCLGAGVGYFSANIVDRVEYRKAKKKYDQERIACLEAQEKYEIDSWAKYADYFCKGDSPPGEIEKWQEEYKKSRPKCAESWPYIMYEANTLTDNNR